MLLARLKRNFGLIVVMVGVLVFVGGFMYDAIFVGIPYQDAPAELQQAYVAQYQLAHSIETIGAWLAALGVVVVGGQFFARLVKSRTE